MDNGCLRRQRHVGEIGRRVIDRCCADDTGNDRGDGAASDGVHVKKPMSMPELIAIVQCVIAERQMSRHQQEPGAEYAPRRTLHLS
jgi:hypothetical protein